jgi:hypothetical protein
MVDLYDEYQFFAESTQFLTERRQAVAQVYLGVNTALIAVVGFLVKDIGISGSVLLPVTWFIFVAGIVACLTWIGVIDRYRKLIKWRYDQLMAMEHSMEGSHQMYTKEYKFFSAKAGDEEPFGFSVKERSLPIILVVLYICCGIVLTLSQLLGWFGG